MHMKINEIVVMYIDKDETDPAYPKFHWPGVLLWRRHQQRQLRQLTLAVLQKLLWQRQLGHHQQWDKWKQRAQRWQQG